ncbi:MAG: hypothetical protein HYW25_03500 [Candidatus Aenigmarchaeota archaeon]|nr:hypothetical protein [Candidatus Aenigmarchaeota archaeon]
MRDVIIDADIASTFGKIGKFDLLRKLFPDSRTFVSAAVGEELSNAKERGYGFVDEVLRSTDVIAPTQKEEEEVVRLLLHRTLGKGEAESIVIAKARQMFLLTNDRIAVREAIKENIDVMDLPSVIRQLWRHRVVSKQSARDMTSEIEEKDNIIFSDKEAIFEE